MKSNYNNLYFFKLSFFLLIFPSLQVASNITSSFIPIVIISILILFNVFLLKPIYFNKVEDDSLIWPIKLFLIWNIVTIVRGVFVAENYWEWKHLFLTGFVMLMPTFVYLFSNKLFTRQILSFWLKYILFSIVLFIPIIINPAFYGVYLSPIMIFLLLFPLLSIRWKFLIFILLIIAMYQSTGSRSLEIYYFISTVFGLLYYLRKFLNNFIFKIGHILFLILPFVLLLLGLTGTFNVFKMDQYINGNYQTTSYETGQKEKISLKADTRTFIYVENIQSALKHNYVLQGRTPANGYDSKYFGNFLKYTLHTGKMQRFSSEVGILNIFLWGGLIGVGLYFLIFFYASYLAIYKSKSYFMKIIGLFIAFQWAYSFVSGYATFDMLNLTLWLLISMCYSTEFRKMDDKEFTQWFKNLFPSIMYGKYIKII